MLSVSWTILTFQGYRKNCTAEYPEIVSTSRRMARKLIAAGEGRFGFRLRLGISNVRAARRFGQEPKLSATECHVGSRRW